MLLLRAGCCEGIRISILNMMSRSRTIVVSTLLSIYLSGNHPFGCTIVGAGTVDVGEISRHDLVANASIAMNHRALDRTSSGKVKGGEKLGRVVRRGLEDRPVAPATDVLNILVPNKTGFFEFVHWDSRTAERLRSSYSKLITTLWMVILFILAAGYNSTLTSMMTVDILRPKVTDLDALIANNEIICYKRGAFMKQFLWERGARKLRNCSTAEEYAKALRAGPDKNGCVAVVDELPSVRVFLKNHSGFIIAGFYGHTGGFGYAFPKESKWLSNVSAAVLNVTQNSQQMCNLERQVFVNDSTCAPVLTISPLSYTELTLTSFKYLYLFVVSLSTLLLAAFLVQLFFPTAGRVYNCEHDSNFEMASNGRTPSSATLTRASSF